MDTRSNQPNFPPPSEHQDFSSPYTRIPSLGRGEKGTIEPHFRDAMTHARIEITRGQKGDYGFEISVSVDRGWHPPEDMLIVMGDLAQFTHFTGEIAKHELKHLQGDPDAQDQWTFPEGFEEAVLAGILKDDEGGVITIAGIEYPTSPKVTLGNRSAEEYQKLVIDGEAPSNPEAWAGIGGVYPNPDDPIYRPTSE